MRIKTIYKPLNIIVVMIKEYYGNKYFKDFLHPLIKPISKKQKYIITAPIPKLLKIKFLEKIS